ncbi:MAG TPA: hypothetical protein VEP73_01475 [Actinomycetota bacterium]|nr:hypothetical protein [Actinomycetota bacterium]
MGLKQELAEPWGLLLGATAGGVAWAAHLPVLVAGGVGVAVWATKAAAAALERRRGLPPAARKLPVDPRTPEGQWLARARTAAGMFADLARGMAAGPLADRVATMQTEVDDTVQALERLAGQAGAAGQALARIDGRFLAAEGERLRATRAHASGEIAAELDRSLASVQAQQQVHGRLAKARHGVLARLESGTLGLESLVARVVELSAMAAAGPTGDTGAVDQLTDELEGIRQGLAETEEVSRQALNAYHRSEK